MEGPGRTRANPAGDTMDMPGSMTEDKQSPVAGLCKHTRRQAQSALGRALETFVVLSEAPLEDALRLEGLRAK